MRKVGPRPVPEPRMNDDEGCPGVAASLNDKVWGFPGYAVITVHIR